MLQGDGKYVGIIGKMIDPQTHHVSDKSARVTLSPTDAMQLLSILQAVALEQGYEIPDTVTHIVELPEDKKKH